MKKVLVALSLVAFIGSYTSTAIAAVNGTTVEVKHDDKKKKKSSSEKSCCQAKGASETKTCPVTGQKMTEEKKASCCSKGAAHQESNTKK